MKRLFLISLLFVFYFSQAQNDSIPIVLKIVLQADRDELPDSCLIMLDDLKSFRYSCKDTIKIYPSAPYPEKTRIVVWADHYLPEERSVALSIAKSKGVKVLQFDLTMKKYFTCGGPFTLRIRFDSFSSKTDLSTTFSKELIDGLNHISDKHIIEIQGYVDAEEFINEKGGHELAIARADLVKSYLEKTITNPNLTFISKSHAGKYVTTNESEIEKSNNRRVEFSISNKE